MSAQPDIRTIIRIVFELCYYNVVRSESDLWLKFNSSCRCNLDEVTPMIIS